MAELPNGTVVFTAFNSGKQIALDDQNNIWQVDGWFDSDSDEIMNRWADPDARLGTPNNVNWENWEAVEYVTVWAEIDGVKRWAVLRPDDFTGETVRTDN